MFSATHRSWHVSCALAAALLATLVLPAGEITAEVQRPQPAPRVAFRRDIEPILRARCYACHGESMQMKGLRLDRRDAVLGGASSARVIVPGNSAASRLFQLVSGAAKPLRMPMSGPPPRPTPSRPD